MKAVYFVLLLAALTRTATSLYKKTFIYEKVTKTWTDAQTYCRNNYIDLATFTLQEENDLFGNGGGNPDIWIGLSKNPLANNYTHWSDGSAVGFTNWAAGEPNAVQNEHCVYIHKSLWHDYTCTAKLYFICYKYELQVIVVQEMKTWVEAMNYCRTFYTDLISLPNNQVPQMYKKELTKVQTPSFWIGLRFLDGSWLWMNQDPLGNQFSLPSCPVPHLRCGATKTGEDVFENRDCEEKMNFVCYR